MDGADAAKDLCFDDVYRAKPNAGAVVFGHAAPKVERHELRRSSSTPRLDRIY